MEPPEGGQARARSLGIPDLVSLARLPLAVAFLLVDRAQVRLPILAAAALSDLLDGWLARRLGPTRIGAVLDPVTDKAFMICAFGVLVFSGGLPPLLALGVLLRDILAPIGFLAGVVLRRPFSVPARAGGKLVTVGQSLTLAFWLLDSRYLVPMAWATTAMAIYALVDYARLTVFRGDAAQGETR
jgi:cardiolipin synthase